MSRHEAAGNLSVLAVSCCSQNRAEGTNPLCGACADGYTEFGSACVGA
jgi:hypothetical protein